MRTTYPAESQIRALRRGMLICLCVCFSAQAAFSGGRSGSASNPSPQAGSAQTRSNEAQASMESALAATEPTLEDLYYLGRAVAANILAVYRPYTESPELTRYLNLICRAILINNPEIELFDGCYVQILDSPELNAFASPGGHILITRGLVEAAASEDMLAAIIAHELAHIKLKHGMAIINQMQFTFESTRIVNRAYEFSNRNSPATQRLLNLRESVATLTDAMLKNGYSQAQEFEADREAVTLMAATGYDPEALLAVFKVLHETQNPDGTGLNATHPSALERVIYVDRWLREYDVQDTRRYRAARFINR